MKLIRVGEMTGGLTDRVEHVVQVWRDAGFDTRGFADINQLIWEKLICNTAFSGPCTVFGWTLGEVMDNEHAWDIALGCAREADRVGRTKKITLSFDDVDEYVKTFGERMPDARPSMLLDHMAHRRAEIDAINGMVPVVAKTLGLDAPYNEFVSTVVRARELRF